MSVNFAPAPEFEVLLDDYKNLGYATKTALLNDALRLFKRHKAAELRAQWRMQAAKLYKDEKHGHVWKDLDSEDFK